MSSARRHAPGFLHLLALWVTAHAANQTELVHYGIAVRIDDGDVVAEPFADPTLRGDPRFQDLQRRVGIAK